jgi:hypothetical protein
MKQIAYTVTVNSSNEQKKSFLKNEMYSKFGYKLIPLGSIL